jgi:hypothetical protein
MYKGKLAEWKVGKNVSRIGYLWIARLISEHLSRGFPEGSFEVHNKIRGNNNLRRYLKQHGESEENFLAEAVAILTPKPSNIRCVGPGHEKPPCADELGHPFKTGNLTQDHAAANLVASQSSTATADSQYFNPDSQEQPPLACGLYGDDIATTSSLREPSYTMSHNPPPPLSPDEQQYTNVPGAWMPGGNLSLPIGQSGRVPSSNAYTQIVETPNAGAFAELSELSSWQNLMNAERSDSTLFDAPRYAEESLPFMAPLEDGSAITAEGSASSACSQLSPEEADAHQRLPQRDEQSVFMSAVMLTCMYGASKRNGAQALCLEQALSAYRRLCATGSPFVLTSAITMLTWMVLHVEGSLTDDVMWSLHRVASEEFGQNDPICTLLYWMFLAAATKLDNGEIDSSQLRRICLTFQTLLGYCHRHSIVARYCLSFHLLKVDRLLYVEATAEAVDLLSQLETAATNILGASDLMTINIVSTLSRAHSRINNHAAALAAIDRSLQAEPLGANHPHRLEIIVRKATICRKLDRWDEAERLYWIAVRGRVATLGKDHRSTNKAYQSLVSILTARGRWDSMRDRAHRLLVDPQVAVTEYESWWRRVVEANRGGGGFRASSEETE